MKPSNPQPAPPPPAEPLPETEGSTPEENRYARRLRIGGQPKPIGGVLNRVETVGLGNLKVITTNAYDHGNA